MNILKNAFYMPALPVTICVLQKMAFEDNFDTDCPALPQCYTFQQ